MKAVVLREVGGDLALEEWLDPTGTVVDDLEEGIARYVEPLDKQSPHAIRRIKSLLHDTRDARNDEREVEAFADCLNSADGQEGVAAFLEKRAPNWTGK